LTRRGRAVLLALAAAAALALPAAASAHAYLVRTVPAASVTLNGPPPDVALTYDEPVEPRFAVISVTDENGNQEATATPQRSPADPDTLFVPVKRVPEGWYLVYWRAISVDGHPVQGAFTFAVGPNPGPAPQFPVPHISQTATTTPLVIARWLALLTAMAAIGLFVLRILIAQPLIRGVEGTKLRNLSIAFFVSAAVSLVALPAYLEESTAIDSLRSFFSFGTLIPLWRTTAFGRGFFDMWICMILFTVAAAIAIWLDRPEQKQRSVAAILSLSGALAAGAAALLLPGVSGHAAQTAPRGLSVFLDWLHMVSGSLWVGGLLGLIVLWFSLPSLRRVAGLAVCVPRFSNVAFASVLLLLGTGIGATVLHMPVVQALWQTDYGKVILIKAGILLATAPLAACNLLRTKPQLVRAIDRADRGEPAAGLLRSLVGGETVLVAGAIFCAALLSSLAPPPPAFAQEESALGRVGPGRVAAVVHDAGYTLKLLIDPNKAAAPNDFALELLRGGQPVRGADVKLTFAHLEMQMPLQEYQLAETAPGVYSRNAPALVMVGKWGLTFDITPKGGREFTAIVVDHATG
jgi:copper transport protein